MDFNDILQQLNTQLVESIGMELNHKEDGFSLERLYQIAGKEDRVITVCFRKDTPSEQLWGDSITHCLLYTERERLQLQDKLDKRE